MMPEITPAPNADTQQRLHWLFFLSASALVLSRTLFFHFTQSAGDDAFITYRYARNLAAGYGLIYNIGEQVQGFSSPLYTLLLGFAAIFFGPGALPCISRVIGVAADLCAIFLLWKIFAEESVLLCLILSSAFVLYPKIVLIGASGMEAPVVTALMLLTWITLRGRRFGLTLFLCALLLLLRLDTALWVVLCIILIRMECRVSLRALALPVVMYGSWIIFCFAYFGSWLPHSIAAKNVSWNHLFPLFDPARVMLGYLPSHFLGALPEFVGGLVLFLLVAPLLIEGVALARERSTMAIFPVFFILYNLAFSFGRILIPDWYYYPGYIAYLVTMGSLLGRLNSMLPVKRRALSGGIVLVCAIALFSIFFTMGVNRWSENIGGLLLRQNKALGVWLKEYAPGDARVLVEPIGYVGWESNLYIDDYIGLVSPGIVDYRKRYPGSDRWYMAFLREQQPEFVVQRNWEFPRNALFHGHGDGLFRTDEDRQWFLDHYALIDWNPRAASRDSVYLVLYGRTAGEPLFGAAQP